VAALGKKHLLFVGLLIFICLFAGIVVYMFTGSIGVPGGPERHWEMTRVTNLEFIDGGSGSDTVVATVINSADKALSITSGYIMQSYWFDNGFIYRSHEQAAQLFGDLNVPANGTKDIHLSLPKDTLIAGKTYTVELNTTQDHPSSMRYMDSQNTFHTISAPEPFTFYHMVHPNTFSPVEEGIITSLAAAFCDSNYADSMLVTVQNTGDFPIIISGGFVNGWAAINATDATIHYTGIEQCTIEKNGTGSVVLNFPAGTLYYSKQNPFNVKLVTVEGNTIEGADMCYSFDFPHNGRIEQPTIVVEKAEIATVQFFQKYGMYDSMTATVHNLGSEPIDISSCLLNGKDTTILSGNTIVEAGSTQTIALQAGTLVQGNKYQLVLISSQNNAFINTSTCS
jgi:hypothetical protein